MKKIKVDKIIDNIYKAIFNLRKEGYTPDSIIMGIEQKNNLSSSILEREDKSRNLFKLTGRLVINYVADLKIIVDETIKNDDMFIIDSKKIKEYPQLCKLT